jgi:hypothetical protein
MLKQVSHDSLAAMMYIEAIIQTIHQPFEGGPFQNAHAWVLRKGD